MTLGSRSVGVVVLLLAAACSGAAPQDVLETSSDDTSNEPPSAEGPHSPASPAPPTTPAPPPEVPGGGTTPPPAATCTHEIEPNDDPFTATPFQTSFCGEIDSAADTDYATFVAPQGATTVTFKHSEKNHDATYRYYRGLVPVGTDLDDLDVEPGQKYFVQIRRAGGGNSLVSYELELSFK